MTKTQQIRDITDKFYNKHPELRKLEFGCEVELWESKTVMTFCGEHEKERLFFRNNRNLIGMPDGFVSFEILGKPITVLQAISLLEGGYKLEETEFGTALFVMDGETQRYCEICLIDPTLPLLCDQSPEVIQQLWELIIIE